MANLMQNIAAFKRKLEEMQFICLLAVSTSCTNLWQVRWLLQPIDCITGMCVFIKMVSLSLPHRNIMKTATAISQLQWAWATGCFTKSEVVNHRKHGIPRRGELESNFSFNKSVLKLKVFIKCKLLSIETIIFWPQEQLNINQGSVTSLCVSVNVWAWERETERECLPYLFHYTGFALTNNFWYFTVKISIYWDENQQSAVILLYRFSLVMVVVVWVCVCERERAGRGRQKKRDECVWETERVCIPVCDSVCDCVCVWLCVCVCVRMRERVSVCVCVF